VPVTTAAVWRAVVTTHMLWKNQLTNMSYLLVFWINLTYYILLCQSYLIWIQLT